jgi:2-polyprenyl-3-methyl-5-hydroxy-6-metoxy-1,4-benzoquinol methylase
MSTGEQRKEIDVAQLMRDVRARARNRALSLDRRLAELHARTAVFTRTEDFAPLLQALNEANLVHDQLRARLPLRAGAPADITFEHLANVPGASRSAWNPKRWIAGAMRMLFRRQEAFNREVVRRLQYNDEFSYMELHLDMTSRLLGTTNTLVQRVIHADRALEEWLRELLEQLQRALADVERARPAAQAMAGALPPPPDPATLHALTELTAMQERIRDVAGQLENSTTALAERMQMVERVAREASQRSESSEHGRTRSIPVAPHLVRRVQVAEEHAPAAVHKPEFNFLAFEQLTRGDEQRIREDQRRYVPLFEGATNVLDAGCGRGEFLELLREAGVDAYGIDSDEQMVQHCRDKELRVEQDFLFAHLEKVPDASLGGLFLGQVVEHLPPDALAALPGIVLQKLVPGASVVLETINPMCLTTFSGAFYADPTHQKPIHPKVLEYYLGSAGFDDIRIMFTAPVPENERLAPVRESAPLEPPMKDIVLQINANLQRLNSLLYSYGNYAMIAQKPRGKAQL